jgi:hypothetical protein
MRTTLIDCMAAMPCSGRSFPRAFITHLENAWKKPATNPQPIAHSRVTTSGLLISRIISSHTTGFAPTAEAVLGARRAPSLTSRSALALVRLQTVTRWPSRRSARASAEPIAPNPITGLHPERFSLVEKSRLRSSDVGRRCPARDRHRQAARPRGKGGVEYLLGQADALHCSFIG